MEALPLTGEQCWRSTVAELKDMVYGAIQRERKEWDRAAWVTAHLLNVSGKYLKRDVSPDQLLGRRAERAIMPKGAAEQVEELRRRQAALDERKE